MSEIVIPSADQYQAQADAFAAAVLDGAPLAFGLEDAVNTMRVLDALFRSAEYHALRMAGVDRYRSLAAQIGPVDWLRFEGGLTWDADDSANGIAAAFDYENSIGYDALHLAPAEIAAATPGIDPAAVSPQGAIFNPGEGWVDLPGLIAHLLHEFAAGGGQIVTDEGAARVIVEAGRAVGARTERGDYRADKVLLATGPSVPRMAADLGIRIDDGTPRALLVWTEPLAHPLKAVLNTLRVAIRPAPGGTFALDADWAAEEGVSGPEAAPVVDRAVIEALLAEASKVLSGNPTLRVAGYGVGRKPIPGDGEPVMGELTAQEMATGARHPMLARFRHERFA